MMTSGEKQKRDGLPSDRGLALAMFFLDQSDQEEDLDSDDDHKAKRQRRNGGSISDQRWSNLKEEHDTDSDLDEQDNKQKTYQGKGKRKAGISNQSNSKSMKSVKRKEGFR